MSKSNKNDIILTENNFIPSGRHNIIAIGGPATGKTYTYVLPNLLQCNGSYIVVDSLGSLKERTEKMFRKKGYRIISIDVREATNVSEFLDNVTSMGHHPTIIYFIPSFDISKNTAAVSALLEKTFVEVAPNAEIPIHIILDGFYELGKIQDLHRLIALNKYDVSCSIIVQSIQDVKMMYNELWVLLVAACDVVLYFGSNERESLKFLLQMVGIQASDDNMVFPCLRRRECIVMFAGQDPEVDNKYNPEEHPYFYDVN